MRIDGLSKLFPVLLTAGVLALPAYATALNHSVEMAPLAAGPYPVACSDIAQDTARAAQLGIPVDNYWDGTDGHYIGDILLEPGDTLVARPRVPDEDLYPQRRNTVVEFVVITCYPTDAGNIRPDYVLANGDRIPRMQRQGQAPRLAQQACTAVFPPPAGCGRFPLMVFSHGLAGSPIDGKSIDFLVRMASYGYIVTAPFHGDKRFSRVKSEDLEDVLYFILNFDRVVELEALRPLSVKAVIDLMLSHPQFGAFIDAARIGGIGGSMGGATMTWLLGAEITTGYPSLHSQPTVRDPRIKAAVGYVPYAGQHFLPAFGNDNATARNVTAPYLALSGTADTTAPIALMEQAMNNFRGARFQVALTGVEHTYSPVYANDVFGWTIPFFDAYLNGNKSALDRLTRQKNVAGGLDDYLRIDYTATTALGSTEVLVDEFFNSITRHFFMTDSAVDKDVLDRNLAGPGWARTGYQFKAYTIPSPLELRPASQSPVCRFYGPGPNSHFYSAEPSDCAVLNQPGTGWYPEGTAFWITRAQDPVCPAGTQAVMRLYNGRFRENDSNHRFTTSVSVLNDMKGQGWSVEGTVMCAPL